MSGKDEWKTLNKDGSEGTCEVQLERAALLLTALVVVFASTLGGLYAWQQFKVSAAQTHWARPRARARWATASSVWRT